MGTPNMPEAFTTSPAPQSESAARQGTRHTAKQRQASATPDVGISTIDASDEELTSTSITCDAGSDNAKVEAVTAARLERLVPLALALLTLAVFAPALALGWVDYDDDTNFLRNPHYRGLGPTQLRWMLTGVTMGHWMPVTWLTHGLDYVLWGMNPLGYHLGNVLLHAANAALFGVLARRLLGAAMPAAAPPAIALGAAAAVLLWAWHPLRVESVAWITERRDVLAALFYLLTVLAWLRAAAESGDARRRWYLTSLGTFALGLMSKSMLVSLPLALLILDVYPLRRVSVERWRSAAARDVLLEKVPYLVMAVASVLVTTGAMRATVPVTSLAVLGPDARVAMAAYGLLFHPWKTLVPLDLRPMYEIPPGLSLLGPVFLASLVLVVAITLALVALRHRWPAGLTVWLAYAVTVAPVSGLVHAGPQLVAERFGYLPSLGLCLLVGAGLTLALARPALARIVPVAVLVWIVSLGALTWSQVQIWRDTDTLFSYALAVDPDCAFCHNLYGGVLGNRGDLPTALPHLQRAAALRPRAAGAHANAGLALLRLGRAAEALPYLERATSLEPASFDALTRLGLALVEVGRHAEAVQPLERARAMRPEAPGPRLGLARAYQALGRSADAEEQLGALKKTP
jgi:hypothetical protein